MTICLNVAYKTEANDFIGWFMIVITSVNILSNLAVVTYLSVPRILKNQRRRLATIRMQKLIKKWEEIDKVLDIKSESIKTNDVNLKMHKAIRFCRDWDPQRRWLLKKGINFEHFHEEKLF